MPTDANERYVLGLVMSTSSVADLLTWPVKTVAPCLHMQHRCLGWPDVRVQEYWPSYDTCAMMLALTRQSAWAKMSFISLLG